MCITYTVYNVHPFKRGSNGLQLECKQFVIITPFVHRFSVLLHTRGGCIYLEEESVWALQAHSLLEKSKALVNRTVGTTAQMYVHTSARTLYRQAVGASTDVATSKR